jgi:hypothetical protein
LKLEDMNRVCRQDRHAAAMLCWCGCDGEC